MNRTPLKKQQPKSIGKTGRVERPLFEGNLRMRKKPKKDKKSQKTSFMKGWSLRWFVLTEGRLTYYDRPGSKKPKGTIAITTSTRIFLPKSTDSSAKLPPFLFYISTPSSSTGQPRLATPHSSAPVMGEEGGGVGSWGETIPVCAETKESMAAWVAILRRASSPSGISKKFTRSVSRLMQGGEAAIRKSALPHQKTKSQNGGPGPHLIIKVWESDKNDSQPLELEMNGVSTVGDFLVVLGEKMGAKVLELSVLVLPVPGGITTDYLGRDLPREAEVMDSFMLILAGQNEIKIMKKNIPQKFEAIGGRPKQDQISHLLARFITSQQKPPPPPTRKSLPPSSGSAISSSSSRQRPPLTTPPASRHLSLPPSIASRSSTPSPPPSETSPSLSSRPTLSQQPSLRTISPPPPQPPSLPPPTPPNSLPPPPPEEDEKRDVRKSPPKPSYKNPAIGGDPKRLSHCSPVEEKGKGGGGGGEPMLMCSMCKNLIPLMKVSEHSRECIAAATKESQQNLEQPKKPKTKPPPLAPRRSTISSPTSAPPPPLTDLPPNLLPPELPSAPPPDILPGTPPPPPHSDHTPPPTPPSSPSPPDLPPPCVPPPDSPSNEPPVTPKSEQEAMEALGLSQAPSATTPSSARREKGVVSARTKDILRSIGVVVPETIRKNKEERQALKMLMDALDDVNAGFSDDDSDDEYYTDSDDESDDETTPSLAMPSSSSTPSARMLQKTISTRFRVNYDFGEEDYEDEDEEEELEEELTEEQKDIKNYHKEFDEMISWLHRALDQHNKKQARRLCETMEKRDKPLRAKYSNHPDAKELIDSLNGVLTRYYREVEGAVGPLKFSTKPTSEKRTENGEDEDDEEEDSEEDSDYSDYDSDEEEEMMMGGFGNDPMMGGGAFLRGI